MAKTNFYAVAVGRVPGIYCTWADCQAQVSGFSGALYKGFETRPQAEAYLFQLAAQLFELQQQQASSCNKRLKVEEENDAQQQLELNQHQQEFNQHQYGFHQQHQQQPYASSAATSPFPIETVSSHANQNRLLYDATNHNTISHNTTQPLHRPQAAAGYPSAAGYNKESSGRHRSAAGAPDKTIKRVPEVLALNLDHAIATARLNNNNNTNASDNDGAVVIPSLALQDFFVEGVRIAWPYPIVHPPQRQMVRHVITALKRKLHVVLESPTGTGKSAALLCSVLAWQRYQAKTQSSLEGSLERRRPPTIIYCSRTHSQVAQMVASLRNTPYRPRMTVLGSRDRLCIHRDINPRIETQQGRRSNKTNVNLACKIRVRNTEKVRKSPKSYMHRMDRDEQDGEETNDNTDSNSYYDDNEPPMEMPGDLDSSRRNGATAGGLSSSSKFLTCPHYRQLTAPRTAAMIQAKFAPNHKSCCSSLEGVVGGARSKMGTLDIEDLVAFGVNPYLVKDVAIYRSSVSASLGLTLEMRAGASNVAIIKGIDTGGAAAMEGSLRPGDRILKVNGKDMRSQSFETVVAAFKNSPDPLVVDVARGNETLLQDEESYSGHSACPYYISRALTKRADLIFAPYNYILDPTIRNAMNISVKNAVVILDEAHNVESTLRESGSGKFGEFELCEMITTLEFAAKKRRHHNDIDERNSEDRTNVDEMSHALLLLLDRMVRFMRQCREQFEKNTGNSGASAAIREWEKFHSLDDKEFEVKYFGPSGFGVGGKAVGCQTFFDLLHTSDLPSSTEVLRHYAEVLESHFAGDSATKEPSDRLVELITKLCLAMEKPEHFYASIVAKANGSLAFAATGERSGTTRSWNTPKALPFVNPRSSKSPDAWLEQCSHDQCVPHGAVYHGEFCDGSVPRWESVLVLELLTPSLLLQPIADQCRTLVLASGSLSPLPSLCAELGLAEASEEAHKLPTPKKSPPLDDLFAIEDDSFAIEKPGRLQVKPPPLEADHVINLDRQLRAVSIGIFPDGSPLSVTYSNYKKRGFYRRLGHAIATVVEAVPCGGVLVFLPSYSVLKNCVKAWNVGQYEYSEEADGEIWARFLRSKSKVVIEPAGNQSDFEVAKAEFTDSIRVNGQALLLAVFRGKMSEGISFNDENARGVICVGLPLPNSFDRTIKAKKAYNDEQRNLRHNKSILSGGDWYSQQAYRAIAQALGRCIRHDSDYGTVVLMDSRHCDDGSPTKNGICSAHYNLPKWMRSSVRNLSMSAYAPPMKSNSTIVGGYPGLAQELRGFFASAKQYSLVVSQKSKDEFAGAQARRAKTETVRYSLSNIT